MSELSDFLLSWLFLGLLIVGPVLLFNGVVRLCVRKKTGPWKEGGASLLAGAIIVGVSVFVGWLTGMLLTEIWSYECMPWWCFLIDEWRFGGIWWCFLIAGLVLAFNGVVQLCVRKKTGPWKEGGASLLAGAIIVGVSVFMMWLIGIWAETWIWWCFLIAGLVLAFNGVVQLCVEKRTGPWEEGGASLLAGAIIAGVSVFVGWLTGMLLTEIWSYEGMPWFFFIAGLVLLFNGVVRLCVRKKTGPWKEGGASLLAGAIIVGVSICLLMRLTIFYSHHPFPLPSPPLINKQ